MERNCPIQFGQGPGFEDNLDDIEAERNGGATQEAEPFQSALGNQMLLGWSDRFERAAVVSG